MPATLADIARQAGVSVATASRVISGSAYRVSDKVRERVLTVAQALNYVPNVHAQALVGARTSTVGVLVHDVANSYFAEVTGGIQRTAFEAGKLVMICSSYWDPQRELEYLRMLHAQRVEAVIMAGSGLDDWEYVQKLTAQVQAFTANNGRVVFISRHHVPGDAILPDNFGGARALGQALVELGHRHIGVIAGPALSTTVRDRMDGFRSALREAGIILPEEQVYTADFSREGGVQGAIYLHRRFPHLTAIAALSDLMAIGAMTALRELGISIPQDISIVGFGDQSGARDMTPAISTVRIPSVKIGVQAMELALEPASTELRTEHVPLQVVMRQSTAPPRFG